ncbi:MAG: serine hydrolase domain-containing protein [Acidobacteriota bacterium]
MKRNFCIAAILFLCFATNLTAQTAKSSGDEVDDYILVQMQRAKIPGLAVAVIRDGKVVKARGYGLANLEHQISVKPETIFQSGSVGKQFTATAVMMLVEDGKISLDDKITKYFKDAPEHWKEITVRHLLSHTAGTTDYPRDFDFRRDYTEDQLLAEAAKISLAFQPGEKWMYSNLGYVMLGILIGKVTGKFYGDFLQERIFKPLGMTSTRIINEADIIPNRAEGYRLVKGELKHQQWVSPTLNTTADGSLYFNLPDLIKWDAALYTEKLLKKSSLDLMWTPIKQNNGTTNKGNYGFGWVINNTNGHKVIEHGGAWQGFKSYIARYVDDKTTVILLANLAQTNPEKLAHQVAGFYIPAVKPVEPKPIADTEPQVTAMFKEALNKMIAGNFERELLTAEMQKQWFPDRVTEVGELLKSFGNLKSVTLIERKQEAENRFYRYKVAFNDTVLLIAMTFTKDNKITAMQFAPE